MDTDLQLSPIHLLPLTDTMALASPTLCFDSVIVSVQFIAHFTIILYLGVTLRDDRLSKEELTEIGSMLFTRNVSGLR